MMLLPGTKSKLNDYNMLCEQYLNALYLDLPAHKVSSAQGSHEISETYGEIFFPSIHKLLSAIPITEEDIFIDLGSGTGKIAAQVFLSYKVKESRGIELVSKLYQQSLIAAQRIRQDIPDYFLNNRKLSFQEGSFLETSLDNSTIALVNSICYSQDFLRTLGRIIDDTPSIHTFMTLRPICTMRRLRFKKVIRIECSWDTTLCYVYGK